MEIDKNRTSTGDFCLDIIMEKLEEIESKLRFLNNEVQDVRMEQFKAWHRFSGLVCAIGNVLGFDDKVLDDIVNVDPDIIIESKRMYHPIDETDRLDWEEYNKN